MLDKQGPESADSSGSATTPAPAAGKQTLTGVLQRRGAGNGASASNQDVAAAGFSGAPMDVPYRSEMESGFGVSFSGVQAYGGGVAAEASSALGAEAYAVGQQVAFKDENPAKEVVAHELAHTIQQGDAGPVQTWSEGSSGDSYEAEANDAAATVLAGGRANVQMRTGGSIQRWGGSDHYTLGNLAGQKAMDFLHGIGITNPGTPTMTVTEGGGVQHGTGAPSLAGAGDAGARARQQAGGVGGSSTGIAPAGPEGNNQTLGVRTDAGTISFGAASRYSGDYSNTVGSLAGRDSELSGAGAARRTGGAGAQGMNAIQFAQMTIGGMTNSNHFYPLNGNEYREHHARAMSHAGQAALKSQEGDEAAAAEQLRQAMMEEGFASHFLQDTFSAGHMAPRSLDSIEDLHNDRPTFATALNNTAQGIVGGTQRASSAVGNVLGQAGGAVGGFFSRVARFENPFNAEGRAEIAQQMAATGASTAQSFGDAGGAMANAATSTLQTGGAVNTVARGVDALNGFTRDAYNGLVRSKQWHDYFCALPNGLPTTRGRFHGDYMMDGNDLETVSQTAANSIQEVLTAAHGRGQSFDVQIPAPDFGGIMADPMAGPAWRMMLSDYRQSLADARAQTQAGDTGRTDGDTPYQSQQVLDEIQRNVFGGGDGTMPTADQTRASAVAAVTADPSTGLRDLRNGVGGIVNSLDYYLNTEFGYNANLSGGLDDNLNAPRSADPDTNSAENHDLMGDGGRGFGFDCCQLEGKYQLLSQLKAKVIDYQAGLTTASGSAQFSDAQRATVQAELDLCATLTELANTWIGQMNSFISGSALGSWAVPLLGGIGVAAATTGVTANNIAWGAGHPEWLTNAPARNELRQRMIPIVRGQFRTFQTQPDFAPPATASAATPASAH